MFKKDDKTFQERRIDFLTYAERQKVIICGDLFH